MKLRNVLLASVMMALPLTAADAQAITGPYISLGAGVNIMQQEPILAIGGVPVSGTNLQTNVGATGAVAGGWGFGNGLRAELEFDYRYNGLSKIVAPGGSATATGSEQKYGPMVNVLYDFTTVSPSFVPYVGVGGGYQWATISGTGMSQTAGSAAAQAIIGAAIPLAAAPGLAITAEYRFMGLFSDRTYTGTKLGNDLNHSVMIGLRYAFGAAPAPVAPMPVVDAGAKTFLVFFDWNKADLTARS